MRVAVAAAGAAAALAAAPAYGALAHSTVAEGTFGSGARPRAELALTRSETAAFAAQLRPGDRRRVSAVDFRRFAVVAALATVATPCHRLRVVQVERRRGMLAVAAAVSRPRQGACIQMLAGAYHVVKVRKSALGAKPPRYTIFRIRRT